MQNHHAIIYPLALALLLALITFWINQTVQEQGSRIDGSNRHDPDYMLNNFVTTQTDVNGKLRYVLAAAEMTHYPDDDSTVLQRPRFTQYSVDKPYTQIQGLRGYVSSDGESVEFVDNVKVVRQAYADRGEMQLTTEKLTIEPDKDLATSNSAVTIKQFPKTVITAVGMVYDKKNQTTKLLKDVHVHYENPRTASIKPTQITKEASPASAKPNLNHVVKKK
ncbi:MAG TPA: LPS export ABC transporter periplasmic protein LptC [Methylophilaceae bacterium]|nr:LPS export ABC transporter periplasmic protein LptC [Methylophilaceae bacterium]